MRVENAGRLSTSSLHHPMANDIEFPWMRHDLPSADPIYTTVLGRTRPVRLVGECRPLYAVHSVWQYKDHNIRTRGRLFDYFSDDLIAEILLHKARAFSAAAPSATVSVRRVADGRCQAAPIPDATIRVSTAARAVICHGPVFGPNTHTLYGIVSNTSELITIDPAMGRHGGRTNRRRYAGPSSGRRYASTWFRINREAIVYKQDTGS